jgi:heme exporter protein B
VGRVWWMIEKDLVWELRSGLAWPPMCLFGLVAGAVFCLQMELLPDERRQIAGGLLWVATALAGMLILGHTFSAEREEGCIYGLRSYPISATMIYFAKLVVNVVALAIVQAILLTMFALSGDISLSEHPWALLAVMALGNLGICAVGTLFGAMGLAVRRNNALLSLLILPVIIPVVLAAAEATRLACETSAGDVLWRWLQLLGIFAVVFTSAGAALAEFVLEE